MRYGGPIRCVHGLSAALVRRGHEVHVCTTTIDGPDNFSAPTDRAVLLDGVSVHYFETGRLRRLHGAPAMRGFLRKETGGFDVAHLNISYVWPNWVAAREAQRAGTPYLMAPHGCLVDDLIRRRSRWIKSAWIQLVERPSLAHAAALHVCSELEAVEFRKLGLPQPEVCCVPNGVERPQQYAPLQDGPYAALPRPYALYLGRINWKKGLDRLVAAWPRVHGLHLVIAGTDEDGLEQQLKAQTRQLGIDSRVHFIGAVDDAHKWAVYENAEMFVLPSYSENFGIVVAEAMAVGCPVVVSPDVGLSQLVQSSGAGIVTDCEPGKLADAIVGLHADAEGRRRMRACGQRVAEQQLSWDSIAAQMEAVYLKLAGERRKDSPHAHLPVRGSA